MPSRTRYSSSNHCEMHGSAGVGTDAPVCVRQYSHCSCAEKITPLFFGRQMTSAPRGVETEPIVTMSTTAWQPLRACRNSGTF